MPGDKFPNLAIRKFAHFAPKLSPFAPGHGNQSKRLNDATDERVCEPNLLSSAAEATRFATTTNAGQHTGHNADGEPEWILQQQRNREVTNGQQDTIPLNQLEPPSRPFAQR